MIIAPVILCGGHGSRLWPLSRNGYPKQFLSLCGKESLLQQTVSRLACIEGILSPTIISNEQHRFTLAEQLRCIGACANRIVLEPLGRNTAPAIAVAALMLMQEHEDISMLVLPSDHLLRNLDPFQRLVRNAAALSAKGKLVTFGITPTEPHTGYGYILHGNAVGHTEDSYEVQSFVEKPSLERAQEFYASGNYLWNSGMFMFRADVFVKELAEFQPDILAQAHQALQESKSDLDFLRLDRTAFAACPSESIDYAVMEKTRHAVVVKGDSLGWSDAGSWTALDNIEKADEQNNKIIGDVLTEETHNCYIRSEGRLIATVGVSDLIIVESKDSLLVASKSQVQKVKSIVEQLNRAGRQESANHPKVFRPWGSYESIDAGERFQVKRIIVNPGASLSLQMHYHRAEHWVVVRGTARIECGDEVKLLTENQSTYIPLGTTHRLANPGKVPLELIEIQSGAYLGEDDIVRFQDYYGRI